MPLWNKCLESRLPVLYPARNIPVDSQHLCWTLRKGRDDDNKATKAIHVLRSIPIQMHKNFLFLAATIAFNNVWPY